MTGTQCHGASYKKKENIEQINNCARKKAEVLVSAKTLSESHFTTIHTKQETQDRLVRYNLNVGQGTLRKRSKTF